MSFTHAELGERFHDGETTGEASNVSIKDYNDFTALVGYGYAIYGVRNKQTGEIIYFSGWDGFSQSTTKQLTNLGLRNGTAYVPAMPQSRTRYNPERLILSSRMEWNELLSSLVSNYDVPEHLVA